MLDMKSEFQDGGFGRIFPSGLLLVDPETGAWGSSEWEKICGAEGLASDYEFLQEVGVVDYSVLLTYGEAPDELLGDETRLHPLGEVGSQRIFTVQGPRGVSGGHPVVLWARLGIIDFLQPYSARKRTETALKSLAHPFHAAIKVTIIDPQSYAARQLEFMRTKVFPNPEHPVVVGDGEQSAPEVHPRRSTISKYWHRRTSSTGSGSTGSQAAKPEASPATRTQGTPSPSVYTPSFDASSMGVLTLPAGVPKLPQGVSADTVMPQGASADTVIHTPV